jgi:hypothetical protein
MSTPETHLAGLMANTFLASTHEQRVEHGTWSVIARAVIAAGYERRPDVVEAERWRKEREG